MTSTIVIFTALTVHGEAHGSRFQILFPSVVYAECEAIVGCACFASRSGLESMRTAVCYAETGPAARDAMTHSRCQNAVALHGIRMQPVQHE